MSNEKLEKNGKNAAEMAAAIDILGLYGLKHAKTFICELYTSLSRDLQRYAMSVVKDSSPNEDEYDGKLKLARSYMDIGEYERAAQVLEKKQRGVIEERGVLSWDGSVVLNQVEFFCLQYTRYLVSIMDY